jgi:putative membrane protein
MMWDDGNGHWERMHDQGSGFGWVMLLLMLVVAVAVVVAVVALLRGSTTRSAPPRPGGGAPDARAILQERFARGEIDEQEFRARIRALDETGG